MHAHLANLEKIGLLRRDPSKPRAIELLFDKAKKTILPGNGLPLVGHVAAGEPILAEENVEEYIEIPDVIGGEDGDYILRVRGESMKNAGIFEGDYVVVRPAEDAANGEIVVALIGEEATVKRFFREDDHIRLQPENETMEPIRTTEATVLGRVVGVFRKVSLRRSVLWPDASAATCRTRSAFCSAAVAGGRRASPAAAGAGRGGGRGRRGAACGPRQRGRTRIGRGRSVSLPTAVATCSGVSRRPEKEPAASGSSSLSSSIGVQIPSGQTARELDPLDAGAAQVEEGAEGEGHRRVLARRVVDLARRRDEAGQRDHVDHVPAAGRDHRLERGDRAVHRAERVDVEHRPARRLVLLPGGAGDQDAGVVDPEVERAAARVAAAAATPGRRPRRARRAPIERRADCRSPSAVSAAAPASTSVA